MKILDNQIYIIKRYRLTKLSFITDMKFLNNDSFKGFNIDNRNFYNIMFKRNFNNVENNINIYKTSFSLNPQLYN